MALTKLNNISVADVTSIPVALGDMVLVSSATASASASIEFTLGDYKEYQFYIVNAHPSTDAKLGFNFSIDSGSNYNVTKTTTLFIAQHDEANTYAEMAYNTNDDLAQSTSDQPLTAGSTGSGNDECICSIFKLFNPSSNTFVKHFMGTSNNLPSYSASNHQFVAGYANTTSALTNIKFQMSSGNIDAGKILMYGIN